MLAPEIDPLMSNDYDSEHDPEHVRELICEFELKNLEFFRRSPNIRQ